MLQLKVLEPQVVRAVTTLPETDVTRAPRTIVWPLDAIEMLGSTDAARALEASPNAATSIAIARMKCIYLNMSRVIKMGCVS